MRRFAETMNEQNPVGVVQKITEVDNYIQTLSAEWDSTQGKRAWWKFWQKSTSAAVKASKFMLRGLDELVKLVDNAIDNGPDKKATVLAAMDRIYDFVLREALPIWARPFGRVIKDYFVHTLIATMIDWIVDKYRNGEWRQELEEAIQEDPTVPEVDVPDPNTSPVLEDPQMPR